MSPTGRGLCNPPKARQEAEEPPIGPSPKLQIRPSSQIRYSQQTKLQLWSSVIVQSTAYRDWQRHCLSESPCRPHIGEGMRGSSDNPIHLLEPLIPLPSFIIRHGGVIAKGHNRRGGSRQSI